MDNVQLRKRTAEILSDILLYITERYVIDELTIPGNILTLKDEACGIVEKAAAEQNADILGEYGRRLNEIYDELCE